MNKADVFIERRIISEPTGRVVAWPRPATVRYVCGHTEEYTEYGRKESQEGIHVDTVWPYDCLHCKTMKSVRPAGKRRR